MPFVMAMSMESEFVTQLFSSSLTTWSYMIYLDQILLLEKKSAPTTFPLLFLQESCFGVAEQGMLPQSFTPV
jgi:hypothetical protein